MEYEEIEKIVRERLSDKRFNHCVGVAKRAVELAEIYGEDVEVARKIGIAHDIAKEMPKDEAVRYADEKGIVFDEIEKKEPGLWHSKIGADMCVKEFEFSEQMAEAILYHTTGNVNMNIMDKIIYIADKTEGNRSYASLERIIEASNRDLDEGTLAVAKRTLEYSLQKDSLIHPDTIELINKIILEKR